MKINSIEMINWKCFDKKKVTFDKLTMLNWKNGEGKTSLIQAIVLLSFSTLPLKGRQKLDRFHPISTFFPSNANPYL